MKKCAFIFPGQGSQVLGMGKDLYDNSPSARNVFETADRVLDYKISDICFSGSEDELRETIYSQPAILTVELAILEALREKLNITPACCAGHSLGEYSALYCSGVVDLESVFKLIQKRASLMNKAANKTEGSMAAVIGLDAEAVVNITKTLNNVYVANYNSPVQIVITGDKAEIKNNLDKFKEAGAKKVVPLAVSGAFHSPLMESAENEFEKFVEEFNFKDTKIPVYTNVDAKSETQGNKLKNKLPRQICSSVLWTQIINNITDEGILDFIEIGPGKVLCGLNKKINSNINTFNISDYESLIKVVSELKEKEPV